MTGRNRLHLHKRVTTSQVNLAYIKEEKIMEGRGEGRGEGNGEERRREGRGGEREMERRGEGN